MSKAAELRGETREELEKQLLELLKEQFNLRMQKGSGQLSRPSQFKVARREIARIKTILSEQAAAQSSSTIGGSGGAPAGEQ